MFGLHSMLRMRSKRSAGTRGILKHTTLQKSTVTPTVYHVVIFARNRGGLETKLRTCMLSSHTGRLNAWCRFHGAQTRREH